MEIHDDNALVIYTDGSCLPSPRRGGYAYRFVAADESRNEVVFDFNSVGFPGATNNQMELIACIEAFKHANSRRSPVPRSAYSKVVAFTDSMYVLEGVGAAEGFWPSNGWLTRAGEPVLNRELWTDLVREKQRFGCRVEFRRVQAHKTNVHNKAVDRLAKLAARLVGARGDHPAAPNAAVAERATPHEQRRTEPGSVAVGGQIETIRILMSKRVAGGLYHGYKYEVVGDASPHFGAVDDAFALNSVAAMRAGHIYEVEFAEQGGGRWITRVVAEVPRIPSPDSAVNDA